MRAQRGERRAEEVTDVGATGCRGIPHAKSASGPGPSGKEAAVERFDLHGDGRDEVVIETHRPILECNMADFGATRGIQTHYAADLRRRRTVVP